MHGRPTSRFLISLILLIIVTTAGADLTQAQPPFVDQTINSGGFVGGNISVAVDHEGRPHVVYWDFSNQFLLYSVRKAGTWTTEVVEATAFVGNETSIAIDAQGVPHVSFHNFTGGPQELRYAHRTGGSWTSAWSGG